MKKTITALACISILFTISAFTLKKSLPVDQSSPTVYKIMEVAYLWDLMNEGFEPNWDTADTWLKTGFRSKYAMAKKYASIEILEATFETDVFLRGPHGSYMDFNSSTSFGYYNPEFIGQVKSSLEHAMDNPVYKKALSYVYQNHFRGMANTYMEAYQYVQRDKKTLAKTKSQYLMDMARPEGTLEGSFQETFRPFAEALERDKGADIYEAFTAPAFWIRRSIDGTDEQIIGLLKMVESQLK